ncbi:6-phosphofructo-2-kinase/fructose-2,6-biphosphatase 2 [Monoraphidium neglectum]|uniref:6-phosphofructo-2-kinase/fructose-2, 6-biphosphatase 2 n=1 Tax=Monoraphidium neglectum TaxID=145388 RepID=A0A0D2LN44_9CHLO|nr:6-phosphofructo-2-kinase/fructose-2,6-biphosphatase 2 [Monoraphidium neglectum]KIY93214.1 6-phosphofructo-2-kinase/fructose-2,6-biphosphatase 2 [Monoraphidium neglectum]|eukprot:XP_013892234.1 6-phosphofructo-2-kinase/fructose-2,6-biphosphatase 2 [Monoraphidium neglectum]
MDVNRISGYIPGKIVFFLMQICKAGMAAGQSRKIWLTRHGESEFNVLGKIGGDSLLSPRGAEYAQRLPEILDSRLPPRGGGGGEDGRELLLCVAMSSTR